MTLVINIKKYIFQQMYLGSDKSGALMSTIPLVSETDLYCTNGTYFDCGFNTFMEQ